MAPKAKEASRSSPPKALNTSIDPLQGVRTALKQRYPGREGPIDLLADRLRASRAFGPTIFVYGPPSTGKTSIVRDLLIDLGLGYAYVNCHESTRTRSILASVLYQLNGGKRHRENGFEASTRCDTLTDFMNALPQAASRHKGVCWIVLDAAHRLASSEVLTALTRAPDTTGANVGVILISTLPWGSGRFSKDTQNLQPPVNVHFPAYTQAQLSKVGARIISFLSGSFMKGKKGLHAHFLAPSVRALLTTVFKHMDSFIRIIDSAKPPTSSCCLQILLKMSPVGSDPVLGPAYRQFLQATVPALSRATTNLLDVRIACARLWPKYSAPLREGSGQQGPPLALRIHGDMQRMISELDMGGNGASTSANGAGGASTGGRAGNDAQAGPSTAGPAADRKASTQGLAFELPYMSKFLLLAAYIASRNKPTADRAVFDPGYGSRGRRNAQALDRQAEAALEATLKGPHSFPLERLLHIFYCIYEQHGPENDGDEGQSGHGGAATRHEVQRAEVQMQLSTLVSLRLLSASSSDVLEGGTYRCSLPDDVARAIAANVKLRLTDYLKLA